MITKSNSSAKQLGIEMWFNESDVEDMQEQYGTSGLSKAEREQFLAEYSDLWSAQILAVGKALLEGMLEQRLGILGKDLPPKG